MDKIEVLSTCLSNLLETEKHKVIGLLNAIGVQEELKQLSFNDFCNNIEEYLYKIRLTLLQKGYLIEEDLSDRRIKEFVESLKTHIHASFRLNSLGKTEDKEIEEIFGQLKGTTINIWHNPNVIERFSTVVTVFGDTNNDLDFSKFEQWFLTCCNKYRSEYGNFGVKQAFCQVTIDYLGTIIVQDYLKLK